MTDGMRAAGLTINRLLREYPGEIPERLSGRQRQVLGLMARCRTGQLGYLKRTCRDCHHGEILPQSCGDRHCPQCLGSRQAKWAADLGARLPAVPHFHTVFTLPHELGLLVRANRRVLLPLFFDAAAETMAQFMAKHWQKEGGFVAVLHTWGQTLNWHPHLHLLVPGGGFEPKSGSWSGCRPDYLFPVKALSRVFRAVFLRRMRAADEGGLLVWPLEGASRAARERRFQSLATTDWVLFVRPTLRHTRSVVRYLARYTSRIGMSHRRLTRWDEGERRLTFRYLDYRGGGRTPREMTLPLRGFLARFAQHVLPRGLKRIRHFGFMSPASRWSGQVPASGAPASFEAPSSAPCPRCGESNWTPRERIAYPLKDPDDGQKAPRKGFPLIKSVSRTSPNRSRDPPRVQQAEDAYGDSINAAFRVHPAEASL